MTPADLESAGWVKKGRRWVSPYTGSVVSGSRACMIETAESKHREVQQLLTSITKQESR